MDKRKKQYIIRRIKKIFTVIFLMIFAFCIFRYYPDVKNKWIKKTVEQEWVLKEIKFLGIKNLQSEKIVKKLPVSIDTPMVLINVNEIEKNLKENSWVDKVFVSLKYPNILIIKIEEKQPVAIIEDQYNIKVIDRNGSVLGIKEEDKFNDLPLISSPQDKRSEVIEIMETQPDFYADLEKAIMQKNHRWDVYLNSGLKIMLPLDNPKEALEKLNELRLSGELLKYKIKYIDFRFKDKVIIKGH